MNNEIFARRLKRTLAEKGMLQKELAMACNITQTNVSKYIVGANLPNASTLVLICKALNVSADFLLGLDRKYWIFTFCSGEEHQHHGHFVRIPAKDPGQARFRMVERFGTDWAFQYEEEEYMDAMAKLPSIFKETELILDHDWND